MKGSSLGYFVLNGVVHATLPFVRRDGDVVIRIKPSGRAWSAAVVIAESQWKAIVSREYEKYFGENSEYPEAN